jgi:hypothetical protein
MWETISDLNVHVQVAKASIFFRRYTLRKILAKIGTVLILLAPSVYIYNGLDCCACDCGLLEIYIFYYHYILLSFKFTLISCGQPRTTKPQSNTIIPNPVLGYMTFILIFLVIAYVPLILVGSVGLLCWALIDLAASYTVSN